MVHAHFWVRTATLILGMTLSPWTQAAPARLIESSSIEVPCYGELAQSVHVKILVPNITYEKNIAVIFSSEQGQAQTITARYVGPADEQNEIWEADATLALGDHSVLVDYAESPQQSSERKPQLIKSGAGPVLYGNRQLMGIYLPKVASKGSASFQVAVKNLAYQKNVLVHFSTDSWKSSQAAKLEYAPTFYYRAGSVTLPNADGFEIWSGEVNLPSSVQSLSYYFSYEANGQTVIDDNFGHYYSMNLR